jgi:branched-chain amino acid transport system substrate-binding protein
VQDKRLLRMAVAATLAAALAACSSTKSSSGSADSDLSKVDTGKAKCGLSNGKKADGAPIKIGAIASMSNGIDFRSAPMTAKAYFDCVNANGGINGRPVAYTYSDDALDPQKASALATKFASDKSVVALTGGASFVACGVAQPIYAAANLYDILAVGVPKPCFFSANMAPVNAGPRLSLISAAQYWVEQRQAKKIATIGLSIPNLGDWEMPGLKDYAAKNGATVVLDDLVAPPVRDATSLMVNVGKRNPDVFISALPAGDSAGVLKVAQQQNLKSKFGWSCQTPCYDTTFPGQVGSYWNDTFTSNSEFTLLDAQTPDNLNWRAVLKEYGTTTQPRDSFSQAGFVAAKILVDTLLKLDPNNITRDTVSTAVVGIKNYRTDIICTPWYFGKADRHNANHALRMVKIDNTGKYVQLVDCADTKDAELAPILAAEKSEGLVG